MKVENLKKNPIISDSMYEVSQFYYENEQKML